MNEPTQQTEEPTVEFDADEDSEDGSENFKFSGSVKKWLGVSVTAVGSAAVLYAFGTIIAIAVLTALVIMFGMYLYYRPRQL